MACEAPAGHGPVSTTATDCDDEYPYTAPGRPELCDQRDNDCTAATTESCGQFAWVQGPLEDTPTLYTAAATSDVHVWVAGGTPGAPILRRRLTAGAWPAFSACDLPARASWASALGTVYLAGVDAGITRTQPDAGCATVTSVAGEVSGLWGSGTDASLRLLGVRRDGTSLEWTTAGGLEQHPAVEQGLVFNDVHGLGATIFAVGAVGGAGRIFRYAGAGQWDAETIPAVGSLNAVSVARTDLAVAVGAGGAVLVFDGAGWSALVAPSSCVLRGVVAFGANAIYVADECRKVTLWNGQAWAVKATHDSAKLFDLAAVTPEGLFAVGESGAVVRWSR
jgi:hypothetical protein